MSEPEMKVVCLDLSGTILNHRNPVRPVPLMDHAVRGLIDAGWEVQIVTSWPVGRAKEMLEEAALYYDVPIIGGRPKGEVIARLLRDRPEIQELVFIDDKPDHLGNVRRMTKGKARVIGFVGSRNYCPELAHYCRTHQVELALSAPDLAETLGFSLPFISSENPGLSPRELAELILGLDHPGSAFGETPQFDPRSVPSALSRRDSWWELIWRNLGWLSCNECIWKLMVQSCIAACGVEPQDWIGDAYKHDEYTDAVKALAPERLEYLEPQFRRCVQSMLDGLQALGMEAEVCRPQKRFMELNRIAQNLERLQEIYPESAWIWDAAKRLEDMKQRLSLPREGGGQGVPWLLKWLDVLEPQSATDGKENTP